MCQVHYSVTEVRSKKKKIQLQLYSKQAEANHLASLSSLIILPQLQVRQEDGKTVLLLLLLTSFLIP
jgi:hypothetical protein